MVGLLLTIVGLLLSAFYHNEILVNPVDANRELLPQLHYLDTFEGSGKLPEVWI
jgi:hypothetical protein